MKLPFRRRKSVRKTHSHGLALEHLENRVLLKFAVIPPNVQESQDAVVASSVAPSTSDSTATSLLAAHWPFDGRKGKTTPDTSGNGRNGRIHGANVSAFGLTDGALQFDGVNDYVDTGNWDVEGERFTISAWIRADSFVGKYRDGRVISKALGGAEQQHMWMLSTIAQGSETRLRFRLRTQDDTTTLIADRGDLSPSQWHHVAAVYDGATMRLYLDGAEVGATSKSGTVATSDEAAVWIGNNPASNSQPFHGLIDNVQVYNTSLSSSEISLLSSGAEGVVTGGQVLSVAPGEEGTHGEVSTDAYFAYESVGYYRFEEESGTTALDWSGHGNDGILHGAERTSDGRVGAGGSFDGVDDYVDIGSWDVDGEQLTIAGWVKAESFVGDYRDGRILSKASGSQSDDHFWMLSTIAQGSETRLRFRLKTDGSTDTLIADSGDVSIGDWNHVAAAYDGSAMRLFLNGVEVGSMPKSGVVSKNSGVPIWIGNNPGSHAQPFHGSIDDMQIFDSALTALQIMTLVTQVPVEQTAIPNTPPVVEAGAASTIELSSSVTLNGSATDDGLPSGSVTNTWSKASGPGSVTFVDASDVGTSATFSEAGTYVLRLESTDGELSTSDTVTISVTNPVPTNTAPVVNAGADTSVAVTSSVLLNGTVTDDGLPTGTVTNTWSKVSGPGEVTFADSTAVDTSATFSQAGTYVLQLRSSDGQLSNADSVTITANAEQQVTGFFVSPSGTPSGDGSVDNPWDLRTALSQPSAVAPGETIWMRGGTYVVGQSGGFTSNLTGTAEQPITVRAYPGEEVVWDTYYSPDAEFTDANIYINGSYTHYWGFEVTNTDPGARKSEFAPGSIFDVKRGTLRVNGDHNKFINMHVHDLNIGITMFGNGDGGEVYGSLFYNNGYASNTGDGRGHNIYTQNLNGTKLFEDNMIFNSFRAGLHAFSGGDNKHLTGFAIQGNTIFNSGAAVGNGFTPRQGIILGGAEPSIDIDISSNQIYQTSGKSGARVVELGRNYGGEGNENLTLTDNKIVGDLVFRGTWSPQPTSSGNAVYNGSITEEYGAIAPAGIQTVSNPQQTEVFVQPNKYESGRGHATVYNWNNLDSVQIDLSSVVAEGKNYEIYHVYDLDSPVASGQYAGGTIGLAMRNTVAPKPLGNMSGLEDPVTLPKRFGSFLILTK